MLNLRKVPDKKNPPGRRKKLNLLTTSRIKQDSCKNELFGSFRDLPPYDDAVLALTLCLE